jgi:hypothetical protein
MLCGPKFLSCENGSTINISGCRQQIQNRVKIGPERFKQIIDLALRHGQILNIFSVGISD